MTAFRFSMVSGACKSTGLLALLILAGCGKEPVPEESVQVSASTVQVIAPLGADANWKLRTEAAEFQVSSVGTVKAFLLKGENKLAIDATANDSTVLIGERPITDFAPSSSLLPSNVTGKIGKLGKRLEFVSRSASTGLERTVAIEVYDDFPNLAVVSTTFKNLGNADLKLDKVIAAQHLLDASLVDPKVTPYQMWTFQGASINWGADEIFPIPAKFARQNVMGKPVNDGRGGGVPVNAFWTGSVGLAIGHLETLPLVLNMPVRVLKDRRVEATIELDDPGVLKPGGTFATPQTFVAVYSGDFYEPLRMYSLALQRTGWEPAKPNSQDYSVAWCGWGYEFNVTPKQMTDTIPKLKELGINWATLDDRWFDTYGDWNPRKDTFPSDSIKRMVEDFHNQGIRAQLWWYPLVAEDGRGRWPSHKYVVADVLKQHPDWVVLGKDGKPARSARGLATLCPALPEVQDYTKALTNRFIKDWDFDGLKLDNIFSVAACYNPKHHHKSPQDSTNAMADVYGIIFQTTRALKPDSVVQICPCGTTPNIAWLPYLDQAVTADPIGGAQVRRRIKWYKALLGPVAAVYGDHVELTEMTRLGRDKWKEHGNDFASTLGTGGVLGTKFTSGNSSPKYKNVALDSVKEGHWKKWISLYSDKMLSRGEFRNLYVHGYDFPEAYAIEKDGVMYYAFFAKTPHELYKGLIEIRGLQPGRYRIVDYVNQRELGIIDSARPVLNTSFIGHLLVEADRQ